MPIDPRMLSKEKKLEFIRQLRNENYDDDEIKKIFRTGTGYDRSGGPAQATLRGLNTGMISLPGMPVDLLTSGINALSQGPADPNTAGGLKLSPTSPFYTAPGQEPPSPLGLQLPQITNPFGGGQTFRSGANALFGPKTTYESEQDLPPGERPFAAAGNVLGSSLSTLGAASALPAVRAAIRAKPWQYLGLEGASAFGGAVGGGAAEFAAPDQPGLRLTGEVLGGILSPGALAARGFPSLSRGFSTFKDTFSKSGRERSAAKLVQEELLNAGEDPARVAARLRMPSMTGKITSAALSESPTLTALENTLTRENRRFGGDLAEQYESGFANLRNQIDALAATGDPNLVKVAARLRKQYFDQLLTNRVSAAQNTQRTTLGNLGGGQGLKVESSTAAHDALEAAWAEAREAEKALWHQVPKTDLTKPTNLLTRYDELRDTLLPSEAIRPLVEPEIARLRPRQVESGVLDAQGRPVMRMEQPEITGGELLRFRSKMQDAARDAMSGPNPNRDLARQYRAMADAALEDMLSLPGDAAAAARDFTLAKHDAFSRTFAGEVLSLKPSGALRIPEELTLERAFGTGGTQGGVNLRGLQEGADFPGTRGGTTSAGTAMQAEQEKFLRATAGELIDPNTGRVNANKLQQWLAKNEVTLRRFPGLRDQLTSAEGAERALQGVEVGTVAARSRAERTRISQLLGVEDPARVVGEALRSANPQAGYTSLANLARKGGADAQAGLKSATLDWAFKQATKADGTFSFADFRQQLTQPQRRGGLSLIRQMEMNGVLARGESARLERILNEAGKMERALASKADLGGLKDSAGALYDLVVRIVGANVGGHAALAGVTGSSLVTAGAAVRTARNLFEKVPAGRVRDVLIEAAREPKFMALLLEKPTGAARRRQIQQQVEAWLVQAGLNYADEKLQE